MLRKIISHTKWLAIYALVGRASWLVTLYLIAMAAGVASYGEFTFYLTFWVIANKLFGLGLDIWLNRHIASDVSKNVRADVRNVSLLRLLLIGFGFIFLGIVALILAKDYIIFVALFVTLGLRQVAESMREVAVGALQGLEKMRLQAMLMIPWDIVQLVTVSLAIYLFHIENVDVLALILLAAAIGKVVTLYTGLRNSVSARAVDFGVSDDFDVKKVLSDSKYIGLTMLAGVVLGQSHILYLRLFTDSVTVGEFAFAYIFVSVALVALGTIRQALFPTMSRLASDNIKHFRIIFIKSLMAFFLLSLSIVGVLILFSKIVMPEIIDPSFGASLYMLSLVSWVLPGAALSGAMANFLIASGNAAQVSKAQVIGVLINQALNVLLIFTLGWIGAFLAMLLTYLIMAFQYWRIFSVKFVANL